jgi:glycosyltransferase involved in cell wall biosynthesis
MTATEDIGGAPTQREYDATYSRAPTPVRQDEPDGVLIIPVYNESREVRRLLETVLSQKTGPRLRIVVVCNGCTDDSAAAASSFPDVVVAELPEPSKVNALNEGDRLADGIFPRMYADADIHIDAGALSRILAALEGEGPLAAGPSTRFLTDGKPWSIRSFYFTLEQLPNHRAWQQTHLAGRGLYGANREGRQRFPEFPPLRNDDAFFDMMYTDAERVIVNDVEVGIEVPSSARELIRNYTRVHDGNVELRSWLLEHYPDRAMWNPRGGTSSRQRAQAYLSHLRLLTIARTFWRPHDAAMLSTYLSLRLAISARRTWRRFRGREIGWR